MSFLQQGTNQGDAPQPFYCGISGQEVKELARLYNQAFEHGKEESLYKANATKKGVCVVRVGNRIASTAQIGAMHYAYVGGGEVPNGLVGGVATWRDLQGRGYATSCMVKLLRIMREQGFAISMLSTDRYGLFERMGYGQCGEQVVYSHFEQGDLVRCDEDAPRLVVRRVQSLERDTPVLQGVYGEYAKLHNGMRTTLLMRPFKDTDTQTFIIEKSGRAVGYFLCKLAVDNRQLFCEIDHFACTCDEAWRAMGGYLATMQVPSTAKFKLFAPQSPLLAPLFKDEVQPQVRKHFMGRIIDMKKAVEMRGYRSQASGAVRIALTDEHAPWVAGTWEMKFADGGATCSKVAADDEGEVQCTMSVQTFSQIWFGFVKPDATQLGCADDVAQLLSDAFHDRTPYLMRRTGDEGSRQTLRSQHVAEWQAR